MGFGEAAGRAIELGGRYDGHELAESLNEMTVRAVEDHLVGEGLVAAATDEFSHEGASRSTVAAFAVVEVDTETGDFEIPELVAVADCGTVLNPRSLMAQVSGGLLQGMSQARFEKWGYDLRWGVNQNKRFHTAKPITIMNSPLDFRFAAVDIPDRENPVGSRGIGEPPVGAGAAVVLNAVYDAIGVYLDRTPLSIDKILNAPRGRGDGLHDAADPRLAGNRERTEESDMAEIRDMMGAFELYQPMELDGALELLRSHGPDAWILSGGLDTFDWLKDRAKSPGVVVDVGGIEELAGIEASGDGVRIGAMTSLDAVVKHPEVRTRYPMLAEGLRAGGHPADPPSGHAGRECEPGHALLVLPERVAVLPGGGEHLLRERAGCAQPGAFDLRVEPLRGGLADGYGSGAGGAGCGDGGSERRGHADGAGGELLQSGRARTSRG